MRHELCRKCRLCRIVLLMAIPADMGADPKKRTTTVIGERIHTLMWRSGRTQTQLARILKIDQGAVSNRLRGKTQWDAWEVAVTAAWLGVQVNDLIPEMELDPPTANPNIGGDDAPDSGSWEVRINRPYLCA